MVDGDVIDQLLAAKLITQKMADKWRKDMKEPA